MESQKAWDRQPKETDKSFSAFSVYLKTGSLRAAYRKLPGKSHATAAPGGWRSWSVKNSWVSRRAAWLDNETRVTQDAALDAKVEVSRTLTECKLEGFRLRLRRFLRASLTSGNPRATASRITAETDRPAASASASSAAAVAGCTVTRSCFE